MTSDTSRFQVLEGHALAMKVWLGEDGALYADVLRRKSTFAGIDPELIDLCQRITAIHAASVRVLVESEDAVLAQDVQRCGMRHVGYLEAEPTVDAGGGVEFHLWDATARCRFLEFFELNERKDLDFRKVIRQVFAVDAPLTHRLDSDWTEHLQELRLREKYILGATQVGGAGGFPSGLKLGRDHISNLLSDIFWRREDGSFPFPSAGGFAESYTLYLVTRGVEDLKDGLYSTLPGNPSLDLIENGPMHEAASAAFFHQAGQPTALVWFIVAADPSRAMTKYGPRGYRFICLDVGGMLSLMSLSAAASGHPFRIYGGFDDELVGSLVGLDGQSFVVCGAALGAIP